MRRIFLVAVTLALATAPVAFSQAGRGEKYAFLVVCSKYNSTQLRDLPYTIEEMEDFRKVLLKTGFDADHVVLLHDKADRDRVPEKLQIEKQFRLILGGLQPNDTVVVAINGHGVHFKGDNVGYFCPLGANLDDKKSLLSMEFFYDLLKTSKARQKLMIVQACQNDPLVSNDFAAKRVELAEKSDEVPEGIAAIFSCMEGQKSYYDPERKRGLFFDHVIRAWGGEYLAAGEQKLDLDEFFRQVRVKTKADALKFKGGVEQVPEIRRDYKGEWAIVTAAASTSKSTNVVKSKPSANSKSDTFVPLFNGTDLTGWKTHPKQKGNWKVQNGILVGIGTNAVSHLYTDRGDYENFHLRVEVRYTSTAKTGVYFRTSFGPSHPAANPTVAVKSTPSLRALRVWRVCSFPPIPSCWIS